jgi:C-3',4' desaturase CrtD
MKSNHTIVIGAGIGGLTTAALLVHAGHQVTVLEAHIYPGGCAGSFYHQGYRFDAGATLVGGFQPGGPHARLAEILNLEWPVEPIDPAWVVHMPERTITQWHDRERWRAEWQTQFPRSAAFWKRQEQLAQAAWGITANGPFPWPPASARDLVRIARALRPDLLRNLPYTFSSVADLLPANPEPDLTAFLDAQLIISAQTTTRRANALYGSAALDLPRQGVNHVKGGIGGISAALCDYIVRNGGKVMYRQKVEQVLTRGGKAVAVRTNKGLGLTCDRVVANTTPASLAGLLGENAPNRLVSEALTHREGWGAFVLYLGLADLELHDQSSGICHHQVIVDPALPPGEGNTVFISLSKPDDPHRAPPGLRAATLSTHTTVGKWWQAAYPDRANPLGTLGDTHGPDYAVLEASYTERVLTAAERALPGLRGAIRLCLPGSPTTFERYTHRPLGMVGGYAQTSIFRTRGPRTPIPNLWLVGDSVFPGQSTAAVTIGAMRTAADVLGNK